MKVTFKQPPRDDYEYNRQKNVQQEEINRILDKIAKSGYESLTKKEKEILFKQGKIISCNLNLIGGSLISPFSHVMHFQNLLFRCEPDKYLHSVQIQPTGSATLSTSVTE